MVTPLYKGILPITRFSISAKLSPEPPAKKLTPITGRGSNLEGRMKFRKLRIAWSVGCGIACLLLIVLWARSYWWTDSIWRYTPTGGTRVDSLCGKSILKVASVTGKVATVVVGTKSDKNPDDMTTENAYFGMKFYAGFLLRHEPNGFDLFIPYWFLVSAFATVATLPWIRWRFRLRTLLVAVTLGSFGLGLILWLIK